MADEVTLETIAANQQTIISKLTTLATKLDNVKTSVNNTNSSVQATNIIGSKAAVDTGVNSDRTFVLSPWPPSGE